MGSDPWDVGAATRGYGGRGTGMLGMIAAVLLLISAVLQLLFAVVACMGVGIGGVSVAGAMPDPELNAVGPFLLGYYGIGLIATLFPVFVQVPAAVALMRARRPTALLWAACAVSLLPACSAYCALTALPAALVLFLHLLLEPAPDPYA